MGLLRAFDEVEPQVTHGVLRLLCRLIKQCKLEPMLFQVGVLQVFLEVLERPSISSAQNAELSKFCRHVTLTLTLTLTLTVTLTLTLTLPLTLTLTLTLVRDS